MCARNDGRQRAKSSMWSNFSRSLRVHPRLVGWPGVFELARFTLSDMVRCSNGVRAAAAGATSMESAARGIVSFLRDSLIDKELQGPSCALVRLYKVHPFEHLEPGLQARARAGPGPSRRGVPCLTLLGTAGDEAQWNDRHASLAHGVIPLDSGDAVRHFPMIQQLVEQLGLEVHEVVEPHPDLFVDLDRRSFNVFHVPDAVGSPFVPAQEGFVLRYGVKSVLGFGGVLPPGSMFAVILFSRTAISEDTAQLFRSVALSVKLALLPFVEEGRVFESDSDPDGPVRTGRPDDDGWYLRSLAATAEQLIDVRGDAVLTQSLRLEGALEDAERRAAELAASEVALVQSEAQARAVIDVSLDAIVGMDAQGRITEFNPAAEAMFGSTRDACWAASWPR
ncbi:MAG: PAS domain S-box protein [Acidimicrobiales bacterium]